MYLLPKPNPTVEAPHTLKRVAISVVRSAPRNLAPAPATAPIKYPIPADLISLPRPLLLAVLLTELATTSLAVLNTTLSNSYLALTKFIAPLGSANIKSAAP